MIKVAHLITGLSTGGAEMMLFRLISNADNSRISNIVISLTGKGVVGKLIEDAGTPVAALDTGKGLGLLRGLGKLGAILKKEKPDILVTWMSHSDLAGIIASKACYRVPVIWNLRCSSLDPKDHPRSLFWILRALAFFSGLPAAVIANSETGRTAHEKIGYRPRRWEIIHNGFELPEMDERDSIRNSLRAEFGVRDDEFLVGMVGRHDPMKDHANFFMAAAALAQTMNNVKFALVGEGMSASNKALYSIAEKSSLAGRVILLGRRADAARVNFAFDVASLSSYSEGFPNVIGEAMACGVPCVLTDAGDARLIVGGTGIVVPPKSPEAMAEGWRKMLSMSQIERNELGMRARARIENLFSIKAAAAKYEELYFSVIRG